MSTTTTASSPSAGSVFFSYGFRPFFLSAALWAVLAMALWLGMMTGRVILPSAFDPVSWHAHAFLFGYLSAVIAGFLLTAVPNWTGRAPLRGAPLAGLFALWVCGRIAVLLSLLLPPLLVALVDLAMPVALSVVIAREIVAGRNWRNLIVLGMLAVFATGNAVFHWEAARGMYAAQGVGLRLGLAAAVMMIAVIGGRIVPAFTGNWLKAQGEARRPAAPMQRFDKGALLVLLAALVLWVSLPGHAVTGAALILAGIVHLLRLGRWAGERTVKEPLLMVLHLAYLLLALGALAMGLGEGVIGLATAQHVWMGGAIGLMTLAVMTRATLGHTGRPLRAGRGTIGVFAALLIAVGARVAAGFWPEAAGGLHTVAGVAWIGAFGGFAVFNAPAMVRPAP
ncbi:MAG: NnrS family protein [Sulfitobacter sp.]